MFKLVYNPTNIWNVAYRYLNWPCVDVDAILERSRYKFYRELRFLWIKTHFNVYISNHIGSSLFNININVNIIYIVYRPIDF